MVNVLGLSMGLTCFTLIYVFIENELSFDQFHSHAENTYRIVKDFVNDDGVKTPDATTSPALANALRQDVPEVEAVTRFVPSSGRLYLMQCGEKIFYERNLLRIDRDFFNVFDFPFTSGNKNKSFSGLHSILLTETMARKYFGDDSPINKVIRINVNNGTDYIITGVLKDVPQNSHFTFDFLIPFESGRNPDIEWNWSIFYSYATLREGVDPTVFEKNVSAVVKKYQPNNKDEFHIQRLTDIHLKSKLKWELSQNGDQLYVNILGVIALFIMLMASINYVNLVIAQSAKRAKEVGVRKVTGAFRAALIRQFLMESALTVFIALAFSFAATEMFLPLSKTFLGRDLTGIAHRSPSLWFALPACALLVGILAGIYPAFYLSSFKPMTVLRGTYFNSQQGINLKRGLVTFQFAISTTMIIASIVIMEQLDFIVQKKLGFAPENVLLLPNVRGAMNPEAMAADLEKLASVKSVARADGILGVQNSTNGIASKNRNNHIALNFIRVDYDFLPTMKIELKEGRNFSNQFGSDSTAIIINESAAKELGLHEPYAGQLLIWDDEGGKTHDVTIIGAAKDFHFSSFRETIRPFGFILEVANGSSFFLKVNASHLDQTLAQVEKVWTKHNPDKPFDYSFQEEQLAQLHMAERDFQKLFSSFTALAIGIASLGLFGLVTFLSESKTKEIGIRKTLGASVNNIVILLSKDFLVMTAFALVIASPLAYYLMHEWLQNFAYHIDIKWKVFVMAGITSVAIVIFTVSFQTVKAAMGNPVESLRSE